MTSHHDDDEGEGPPPFVPYSSPGYFLGSHSNVPKTRWWDRHDPKWRAARGLPPANDNATLFFVDDRSPSPVVRAQDSKRKRRLADDDDDDDEGPDDDDDDGDFDPHNVDSEPVTVWTGRSNSSRRKRRRVTTKEEYAAPQTEITQLVHSSTAS